MAIATTQSTAIFVIACALAAMTTTAVAQDPAYVNAGPSASAADPARVGGPATSIAPQSQTRQPASIAMPQQETLQRLQRAEVLQAQLAAQFDDGSAVSRDQRLAMQQWFGQSNGLLTEAWRKLGSDRSGAANPAARIAGDNAAPMFDSLESLQRDPRVQQGAQQAQAAMDAMQRTLLPMLQDLRNDIDAELNRAAARSR
jgi:hypothetical protein